MKEIKTIFLNLQKLSWLIITLCCGFSVNAQHFCITNTTGWGDNTCVTATATTGTVAVAGLTTCHRLARVALAADHSFGATDCAIGLRTPGGRKIWLFAGSGWSGGLPDVCKTFCDNTAARASTNSSNACDLVRPDGTDRKSVV